MPGYPDGMETGATGERSRDFERFLTFVDAVVAIAITLLVLPLVDVAGEITRHSDVIEVLGRHVDQFLAFGISFWVIARLWFAQHAVLGPVAVGSMAVSVLVMLWLATIVVLPFTTSLVAQAGEQTVVKALYLGTLALGTWLMAGVSLLVSRHPGLRDGPSSDPAGAVAAAVALVVALVVAVLVPGASYWPLLLLAVSDPAARWWRRRRGPLRD